MNCLCPGAGYCPTFGKKQSSRMQAICRGEVLTPEKCEAYRTDWLAMALARGFDSLPCLHRGHAIGQRIQKVQSKDCQQCAARGRAVSVFHCDQFGACTLRPWQIGQREAACSSCQKREALVPRPIARRRVGGLLHSRFNFNNSLLDLGGRRMMAYRHGWDDARIALAELDQDHHVIRQQLLPLKLGQAREDPRLFLYRDQLHVSYSVVRQTRNGFWTDIGFARLAERGGRWTVAAEFCPRYASRNYWEKNWGFFEHRDPRGDSRLCCVYSIRPHRVLAIDEADPTDCRAELLSQVDVSFPGKLGHLHGGAPPVRHGDEYYCFYHAMIGGASDRWYTLELYTFEASPPFRPRRHVSLPLLSADPADRPAPHVPHCVFPGGAFLENDRWIVSFGYYDKWSEVATFDAADVERCLVPVC